MIKLSQFTLEEITTRGRTTITKDKGYPEEIYPVIDVTHVMRRDTAAEIFLETKVPPTRRLTRKDTMLTPLNMMNQLIKYSEKKRKIPQVMRNMNSTSEDKYNTCTHVSIWIRWNEVSDTWNQYTGFENQMMK